MTEIDERVKSKIEDLDEEMTELQPKIAEYMRQVTLDKTGSSNSWGHEDMSEMPILAGRYERWYNSAYPLVSEYLPDREEEFQSRYDNVISGIEINLEYIRENDITSVGTLANTVSTSLLFQINQIRSITSRVESEKLKAKRQVSNQISSNELQKAKELFDQGNIRSAGVVAGVALERHLLTLCESSTQELEFGYMDGITNLAHTLSDAEEITDDDQRLLEYLSGIRNKCSHASEEEPKKSEIDRMLNQSNNFLYS